MAEKWHGRKDVKENILAWKESDDPFLLLHVQDTQEIRDVRRWMKAETAPLRFAAMQRPSYDDGLIVKNVFLKELTEELDGKNNFPSFYKEFSKELGDYLPKSPMRQEVGNNAQAGEDFSATDISQQQNQNIQINQLPSLDKLRENNIEYLFELFLNDFQQSFSSHGVLLLFQFLKAGFQGFSDDGRQWLYRLCKNLSQNKKVKICIINQCELDELLDFDTDHVVTVTNHLSFDDILKETGDEAFCCGLVEPPDGKIIYSDFKKRYTAFLKRRAS